MKAVLALAALALGGCVTMAPGASSVTLTRHTGAVEHCTPKGQVRNAFSDAFMSPDVGQPGKDLQNQAAVLGADTVLITSALPLAGIAYRCAL